MNSEVKEKWVAALESGEYRQSRSSLRNGDSYCCLGVLCDLYQKEHPETRWVMEYGAYRIMNQAFVLPKPVKDWADLTSEGGEYGTITYEDGSTNNRKSLANDNDRGKSFAWIAKTIKENF